MQGQANPGPAWYKNRTVHLQKASNDDAQRACSHATCTPTQAIRAVSSAHDTAAAGSVPWPPVRGEASGYIVMDTLRLSDHRRHHQRQHRHGGHHLAARPARRCSGGGWDRLAGRHECVAMGV